MAISDEAVALLNKYTNAGVANKVGLGTLIRDAEQGGLAAGSVALANLAAGITFSHRVFAAGKFTTAGGDASETITITGGLATDIVHVTVQTAGGTPRSIVAAVPGSANCVVTLSGDPSTDHILGWVSFRAAA